MDKKAEDLSALSRQYIRGELSTSEYRENRKALIDKVTGVSKPEVSRHSGPASSQHNLALKLGVISIVIIATLVLVLVAK